MLPEWKPLIRMILAIAVIGWSTNVSGQEFRIETQIYQNESTQPTYRSVTLFTPQLVYDFLMSDSADQEPVEMVIFDTRLRQLVLLDLQRQIQVVIPDLQLIKLAEGLRKETLQNEKTKFLVEDHYEEKSDWSAGWVTLSSPTITYRVQGSQPKNVSILPHYFSFLDQFTRLNVTNPTGFPPFPRMRLNRTLKQLGWIPAEVQITVNQNELFRESFQATSKHVLTDGHSESDQNLIANAKKHWLEFKQVDLAEYRGFPKQKPEILSATETLKK